MDKVLSKEMVLGSPFYPHDCGGMIECVTYKDSLKAMDEYAKQLAIGFAEWMQYDYGWGNLAGKYYSYADTDVEYDAEELYEMYLQSLNK